MTETIFEKIIKRELPAEILYEDDDLIAFLDIEPVNPGHTLLIPKKPYENLYDIPNEILQKIGPVLKSLAVSIKESVGADGINIWMNNEKEAGQVVFHAHFHIIPRFKEDKYELWQGKPYLEGEMSRVAKKIRENL